MTSLGELQADGDRRQLRFERTYDAPIDDVWSALTDPERLGRWLAPGCIGDAPGESVALDFGEGGTVSGAVLRRERPSLLELEWRFSGETQSVVRFALRATGSQTHLVLEHLALGRDHAVGYAAGWHAHLETLRDELEGGSGSWEQRFASVLPSYRQVAETIA
jgi:uncharacterized protein YndB with AHSA1/START domain